MLGKNVIDLDNKARLQDYEADDIKRQEELDKERKNKNFTQVYPKGWKRIQYLMQHSPSAARIYALMAEHIDGECGAVVISQEVIADTLGIHVITVKRQTKYLEKIGAILRIRVGSGVYAYALDPKEVWKSWDNKKETAAFLTKTLVSKKDKDNTNFSRRMKVMLSERKANPDLFEPSESDLDISDE